MNIFVLIAGMRETMKEAGYSRELIDEKSLAVTKAADYDAACALIFQYTTEAEAVSEAVRADLHA